MANALANLGYKISIHTMLGRLDKFIYRPRYISDLINVDAVNYSLIKDANIRPIRKILNLLIHYVKGCPPLAYKDSIIIDGLRMPGNHIANVKSGNNIVLCNHAGSLHAAVYYFSNNSLAQELNPVQSKEKIYLTSISKYTCLLLQSSRQAEEISNKGNFPSNFCRVIKPSTCEQAITDLVNRTGSKPLTTFVGKFNVAIIGSVQERKGQHLVPEIAVNLLKHGVSNIIFHIVGNVLDRSYLRKIEDDIKKRHIENHVIIHGFKKNYLEYMSQSNLILQVSAAEGVSRVLREAMALGKAIVSFRLDGTDDLLLHEFDSLLCNYGDVSTISESILKLYRNGKLRSVLANNARKRYYDLYSFEHYQSQVRQLFEELTDCYLR